MKRSISNLLLVAALLVAGAGMSRLLVLEPDGAPLSFGIVTLTSSVLLLVALTMPARRKELHASGYPLAVAGSMLLVLAMITRLVPGFLATRLPGGGSAWMSSESVPLLLPQTGMLGLAVGLALWLPPLLGSSTEATDQVVTLQGRVSELAAVVRSQSEKLHEAMTVDQSTGTLNKGAFTRRFDDVLRRSIRFEKSMAFVLILVDEQDHAVGSDSTNTDDNNLREIARSLQSATRGTDFVGRLGDSEFGMLLGECDDPLPAIDRFLLALDDSPGFGRELLPPVRLSAVTVEDPSLELGFSTFLRAARDVLRAPRTTEGAFWGRVHLRGPGSRVTAAG